MSGEERGMQAGELTGDRLVIQLARLGDYCQTIPLLQDLRAGPAAGVDGGRGRVVLVCDSETAAAAGDEVDEIIPLPLKRLRQHSLSLNQTVPARLREIDELLQPVRERKWHSVFNLNINALAGIIATMAIPERHYGWQRGEAPSTGSRSRLVNSLWSSAGRREQNNLNLADLYRRQLSHTWRCAVTPRYRERGPVLLHPGAGAAERRLPLQFWSDLARLLAAESQVSEVLLTGSGSETKTCSQIARMATGKVRSIAGETGLPELRELMRTSLLLIAVDTGVLHLGAIERTPLLGLFPGSAWWGETAPFQEGVVTLSPRRSCYPCSEAARGCRYWECFTDFDPETVVKVARAQIRQEHSESILPAAELESSALQLVRHRSVAGWLTGCDYNSGRPLLSLPGALMRSLYTGSSVPMRGPLQQEYILSQQDRDTVSGLQQALEEAIVELERRAGRERLRTLRLFGGIGMEGDWQNVIHFLQRELLGRAGEPEAAVRLEKYLKIIAQLQRDTAVEEKRTGELV